MSDRNDPAAGAIEAAEIADDEPWDHVNTRQRWWTTIVLTMLLILSFVDRNIMRLLVEPLRRDLGIDDLQISLLVGISFTMLYSIACLPFGFAADRFNRSKMLCGAVACWSGMSMLCGFANSYWQLFAGRAGLGIGEAALQPSAATLIRDSYPPHQRARAFSIFAIGPMVGNAVSMLVGGYLFSLAEGGLVRNVPFLNQLRPWQFTLALPGFAGMALALLILTIKEPPRPSSRAVQPTFGALFAQMRGNRKLYALLFAAPTLWSLANAGWSSWLVAGLGRSYGLSIGEIGKTAGLISLAVTPVGLIGSGFLIDWLARRGYRDGIIHVSLASQLFNIIPSILIFYATSLKMMWWMYALSMLINGSIQITASAVLTEITPGRLIGKAAALLNMTQNFLGLAIGPTIFALVAAAFFGAQSGLVKAMMLCYVIFIILSALMLALLVGERRRWHAKNEPAANA